MYNRGGYRIRKERKTEDDLDPDFQEQLKLSIHAKGNRHETSQPFIRKHQESSKHSRLTASRATNKMANSAVGSRAGQIIKKNKNGVVDIEFNNARWLSIVASYDAKKLRNVTISKKSCQTFLKQHGSNMKNDPSAFALLKDINRHFRHWLVKISDTFSQVIDDFLRSDQRTALQIFRNVQPTLQSISHDTNMMEQKLQTCLKLYESNQFRKLFARFQSFNHFSQKLEELIKEIFLSKNKIQQLFSELQNPDEGKLMDKKVQKIVRKGVREAQSIMDQTGSQNLSLRDQIISKVRLAIQDTADKTLGLFNRVKGAKQLVKRINDLINDSRRSLQPSQIRKISKIFKTIIQQANKFQDFVSQMNYQQENVNSNLRDKLFEYRQSIREEKRAVSDIQMLFVQTTISQAINTLKQNYSIQDTLAPNRQKVHYNEFNHTLQEISDAMLDQTSLGNIKGLINYNKSNFSKLEDQLDKIKRTLRKNQGIIYIDTENGEIDVMEYCSIAQKYKNKVKSIISKHQDGLRNLGIFFRQTRLIDIEKDPEVIYLKHVRTQVETINNKRRRQNLARTKGFMEITHHGTIVSYGSQAKQSEQILDEINKNKEQITAFNSSNPIKNLIKTIRIENQLYFEAKYLLDIYKISNSINEKNLIQSLTNIGEKHSSRQKQLRSHYQNKGNQYQATKYYKCLLERIYCFCIQRGLKQNVIKQLDDKSSISFPQTSYDAKQMENQIKYRSLIAQTISQGGNFVKNKIKQATKTINDMIASFRIIEKINRNENGQFIQLVQPLSYYATQYFKLIIYSEDINEKSSEFKKIILDCTKVFKNKLSNIDLVDQQIDMETADAALKARNKIIQIQKLNQQALNYISQLTKRSDFLEIYSHLIFALTEYIQKSKQISYTALNQFKQPIWFSTVQNSKGGLVQQINLKGYRRGTFTDAYIHQAAKVKQVIASPAKQRSPSSEQKKMIIRAKSHPMQSMDEQIKVQSDQEQIGQGIGSDIDEAPEQLDMEEDIQEIGDDIADEMEDEVQQYPSDNDDMEEEIKSYEESNIKKPLNNAQKPQQKIKQQKVAVVEQKKYQVSVYEIIPYFKDLYQIRGLFLKIDSAENQFWFSQIDYSQFEDFYHREENLKDRVNFIKSVESAFSIFMNKKFGKEVAEEMKKLQKFISLKQKFNYLGEKNWKTLLSILNEIGFSYSLLLNQKSKEDILQIKITPKASNSLEKQGSIMVLKIYLSTHFKSSYFNLESFLIEQYLGNCFTVQLKDKYYDNKQSFQYVVKVFPKSGDSLPNKDTHNKLLSLAELQQTFCSKLITNIDLQALFIQLWVKAVDSDCQDYYKPDYSVINGYLKKIEQIQKKEWIGYYMSDYKQNILKIKQQIKQHKNIIENNLFKVDNSTIWQCIKAINDLYSSKIKRKLYIKSKTAEKLLSSSEQQKLNSVVNQSELSAFICSLFDIKQGKQSNYISDTQIIEYVIKHFEAANDLFSRINSLLNILEIEHFYSSIPQFFIESNLDNLTLKILRNLGQKDKNNLQYAEILTDLFKVEKKNFTNIVSVNKNVNLDIFTKDHIDSLINLRKQLNLQINKKAEQLSKFVLGYNMTTLFFEKIDRSTCELLNKILGYKKWLGQTNNNIKNTLQDKSNNLLLYVKTEKKQINSLEEIVCSLLKQISSFSEKSSETQLLKIIGQNSIFLDSLCKWAIQKQISKKATKVNIIYDDQTWAITLFFDSINHFQFSKMFISKYILKKDSLKGAQLNTFSQFYKMYIEPNTSSKTNGNITDIFFQFTNLQHILMKKVRQELVDTDDLLLFTKLHNVIKFCPSALSAKKPEEMKSLLIKKMKDKLFQVQIKQFLHQCDWKGLAKLSPFQNINQCYMSQLLQKKEEIKEYIDSINQISPKDTDLSSFTEWFKKFGVQKMKMNYFAVKSSSKVPLAILPVLRIQKDKSKSSDEIKKNLSQLKLPSNYTIQLQNGVSTIYLEKQSFSCKIIQSDKSTLQLLQSIPKYLLQDEIYLLSINQILSDGEIVPLYLDDIKVNLECIMNLKEYENQATIVASVWIIEKKVFDDWKQEKPTLSVQSMKSLKEKMRGYASKEERVRDVLIGQSISFTETGNWLREKLKSTQEKIKIENQKQRQRLLKIKQSKQFLETIYTKFASEELPIVKISYQNIQKSLSKHNSSSGVHLQGYSKKINDSYKRFKEEIEESKSSEQISRINQIIDHYSQILKSCLEENITIEKKFLNKAVENFEVKKKQKREIKQKEKQRKKEEKLQLKAKQLQKQRNAKISIARLMKASTPNGQQQLSAPNQFLTQQMPSNSLNIPQQTLLNVQENRPNLQQGSEEPLKQEEKQDQQSIIESSDEEPEPTPETIDAILQFSQLQSYKGDEEKYYMNYLILLLQSQKEKKAQFYRSILQAFWRTEEQERSKLVLLRYKE